MPLLLTKSINPDSTYAVWRIHETTPQLKALLKEDVPEMIQSRQAEWIVTRFLVSYLCSLYDLPYQGTVHSPDGKPLLVGQKAQISITHSFPYAAAMIHLYKPCGIDIELPRQKMITVRHKYLHESEYQDSGETLERLSKIWAAKEVMYKLYGKKSLSMKDHLKMTFDDEWNLKGHFLNGSQHPPVPIKIEQIAQYILAFSY